MGALIKRWGGILAKKGQNAASLAGRGADFPSLPPCGEQGSAAGRDSEWRFCGRAGKAGQKRLDSQASQRPLGGGSGWSGAARCVSVQAGAVQAGAVQAGAVAQGPALLARSAGKAPRPPLPLAGSGGATGAFGLGGSAGLGSAGSGRLGAAGGFCPAGAFRTGLGGGLVRPITFATRGGPRLGQGQAAGMPPALQGAPVWPTGDWGGRQDEGRQDGGRQDGGGGQVRPTAPYCPASQRSASNAAMQPMPALVTA